MTKGQAAIIALVEATRDTTGNMPPLPGVFPDLSRADRAHGGRRVRELAMVRWGMPSS